MLAWIRINVFQCDDSDAQYQAEYQVEFNHFLLLLLVVIILTFQEKHVKKRPCSGLSTVLA